MPEKLPIDHFPSLKFEKEFNKKFSSDIKIAGRYNPPEGFDSIDDVEREFLKIEGILDGSEVVRSKLPQIRINLARYVESSDCARKLAEANPELQGLYSAIKQDSTEDMYDFVRGVSSKFSIQDIEYQAQLCSGKQSYEKRNETWERIDAKTGLIVQWNISPSTAEIIENALEEHKDKKRNAPDNRHGAVAKRYKSERQNDSGVQR